MQEEVLLNSQKLKQISEPKVENLGEKIKTCEDANQLRVDISDALIEIKETIDSWEEIKTHAKNIKNKIAGYYNLVTSKENEGRYEAGRLVVPVASTVIPVVGQVGKISKAKTVLKGIEELSETKADDLMEKLTTKGKEVGIIRFVAKTGEELKTYLKALNDLPKGVSYEGSMYRSLTIESQDVYFAVAEKMTDYHIYSSWGRYDLDQAENAMYLSKTIIGNKTEVLSYVNDWKKWNTYEFKNIKADNLLDLTDDLVVKKIGTQYDDLIRDIGEKKDMYEMTNVIASWARQKGYNGIIAPGARGPKDYQNIILFEQTYIDNILKGKTIEKLVK